MQKGGAADVQNVQIPLRMDCSPRIVFALLKNLAFKLNGLPLNQRILNVCHLHHVFFTALIALLITARISILTAI